MAACINALLTGDGAAYVIYTLLHQFKKLAFYMKNPGDYNCANN
ncbi:hypothetical protein SEEHRA23_00525 [Salmonella enterica subsp. enterica serovar Heidelberg str. SARA33]|nr:hypothetical protein SEEHRA23_00525 [Salmonella enterica subsp. enterica serovar Heidelberg str. SARA33]